MDKTYMKKEIQTTLECSMLMYQKINYMYKNLLYSYPPPTRRIIGRSPTSSCTLVSLIVKLECVLRICVEGDGATSVVGIDVLEPKMG